jgi:Kef-type K+ transport system membrane component KefB
MVSPAHLPELILALAVIVVAARLFGVLARRLGQPAVTGEILAGILLGPTLAGGAITATVFPSYVHPALSVLADSGVCIFMFFVGLLVDRDLLRGQGRIATTVSVSAMVLPFGLGVLLALYLAASQPAHDLLAFVLFIGTAMSITAFPVLARILSDGGLIRTPIGGLALASAALDDVLAWSLLAVVVAITDASRDPWRVLLVVPFAAVLLKIVRPLLARLAERHLPVGTLASSGLLLVAAAGLLLCAEVTDWMGLHPIFGAFLFGVVMPRDRVSALCARVLRGVEKTNALVLLPVFFLIVGFKVNLADVDAHRAGEFALILVVAIGGKGIGAFAGARVCGARPRHCAVLAVLINTRGLTELIALTVGLQLGLLNQDLYSLMVVMALVTTAMTGVLLRLIYPPGRVRRDVAAHDAAAAVATDAAQPGPQPTE